MLIMLLLGQKIKVMQHVDTRVVAPALLLGSIPGMALWS